MFRRTESVHDQQVPVLWYIVMGRVQMRKDLLCNDGPSTYETDEESVR